MNLSKTQFMSNREGEKELWLNGAKINKVEEYKYLGQIVKFKNNIEGVIKL